MTDEQTEATEAKWLVLVQPVRGPRLEPTCPASLDTNYGFRFPEPASSWRIAWRKHRTHWNTELIHSYSLFEGTDTDQNYTIKETHRVESERFQVWSFHCPQNALPSWYGYQCVAICTESGQPGKLSHASVSRLSVGSLLHKYEWLIAHKIWAQIPTPPHLGQVHYTWPKQPTVSHLSIIYQGWGTQPSMNNPWEIPKGLKFISQEPGTKARPLWPRPNSLYISITCLCPIKAVTVNVIPLLRAYWVPDPVHILCLIAVTILWSWYWAHFTDKKIEVHEVVQF